MIELPFQQTFVFGDLAVIGLLIILEGVLSIDNALVLGLLAKRLPKHQQGRALTYGLVGAFVFRFVAIATAQYLLRWNIVKLLGGAYLLYVALKYFLFESRNEDDEQVTIGPDGHPILDDPAEAAAFAQGDGASGGAGGKGGAESGGTTAAKAVAKVYAAFWPTVVVIELTDIAFAVDSILAAIALVGGSPQDKGIHPKLWVVIAGGMLGVVLMRFAAVVFIKLLEKFPRFEISAYLLVAVIGAKLAIDWGSHFSESLHRWINFHDPKSPAFWTFWLAMLICLGLGFIPKKKV